MPDLKKLGDLETRNWGIWKQEIGGFGNKYLPDLSINCGCFSFGVFCFNLQTSKQFYTFQIRRNVT